MVRFMRTVAPSRAWRLALCAVLCLPMLSCGGDGSTGSTGVTTSNGGSTGLSSGSSGSSGSGSSSGSSGSSGSSAPTGPNVASVVVNGGPSSTSPDVNTLFTTVTVCAPGSTTNCQTIDNIQVDTGSWGLRILAPVLTISLPLQMASDGGTLVECAAFADGYSWGPVALANVQVSGESASSVPVQVIGSADFTNVPANCSSIGPPEDTVATFGANGVLGVGVFAQDCGAGCTTVVDNQFYYSCTSSSVQCEPTTVPSLASQVTNPISLFPTDNNGVIIQLPSVAANGAATVLGYMIFGVDTETNNASGSQAVLTVDPTAGDFTTVFNSQNLTTSFLDTGSNGLFFLSSINQCGTNLANFYCPTSTMSLSAVLQGQNGTSVAASFSVGDAETLNDSITAAPMLAGTFPTSFPGSEASTTFDWGLPFYFGRTVYTVIEGDTTKVGTGPYVAF
jgi:Protein of unknown function (DUF3443)